MLSAALSSNQVGLQPSQPQLVGTLEEKDWHGESISSTQILVLTQENAI